ncbi:ribonucleases P/MRP protein subunit POP1 isoform X2 [Andrographis paniculata]|uniref:ribonucleases P/MRP protein subunit POP1 isoform X2 n=1 Tax=Andrographis paniculata TaxID=175694 RepID=UPI0021E7CB9A|nr:ribonucleases P/MRP protein subunit POP1 isoform X2 [Andrographis paniculata]
MVANWGKAGAAPPHELNVWKFAESRAPELQGLHSIVAQRSDNNFQSQRNKRRRTTGHDNRIVRRKFRKRQAGKGDSDQIDSARKDESQLPRRIRRKNELKKNASSGFVTSGDGTKRLRTHVWHAKRFTMTKLWGFHIPLGLHGRGRGSRALLKKLKHGVLIHDASYYGCVQLEGSEDSLVLVLSSVLVPCPLTISKETSKNILDGTNFGIAMIHHVGKPFDPPIAPVTYMWQPLQQMSANVGGSNTDISDSEEMVKNDSIIRKVWIWIHAAAFRDAYDALRLSSEKPVETGSVHCVSREGQVAKLELVGSKVFELLNKTLQPAACFDNSWYLKKSLADKHDDSGPSVKRYMFENGDQFSSPSVDSLLVKDPRTFTNKVKAIVPESKHFGYEECELKEQTISPLPRNEVDCVLENCDLWDSSKELYPPVEESVLSMEKQQRRMEFVCLSQRGSGTHKASSDLKYSPVCPILLLKNESREDSVTRCSVILPLTWVKAFWHTFTSNGAHAIGLREKYWVSCATGLPYFPLDFPDCNAYVPSMAVELDACSDKAGLLPPSEKLLGNPLPPSWDHIHLTLENISHQKVVTKVFKYLSLYWSNN